MSKKFKIFRNYGVLAAEKRNVYTYGGANPLSDYAEEITVKLPDNEFFELEENGDGNLFVKSAWGWEYEVNELLHGNKKPCFFALDKSMDAHRSFLDVCEESQKEDTKMKNYTITLNGNVYDVMEGETITIKDRSNYDPELCNNGGKYVYTTKFWKEEDSWFCQEYSSCDFVEPEDPFEVSFEEVLERLQHAATAPDYDWWIGEKKYIYLDDIKILVQDGCTEKEAEKHLASGAVVLEEEDFRIFFSDYMKGWEIEGGDQQPYREMLENKIPLPDWGVVEYDGKTYFIAYVL